MLKPGRTSRKKAVSGVPTEDGAGTVGRGKSTRSDKPAVKEPDKVPGKQRKAAKAGSPEKGRAAKAPEFLFLLPPKPRQILFKPSPTIKLEIVQVSSLERFETAHEIAKGEGVTVAVLDSGCFTGHLDFQPSDKRVAAMVDCTTDPPGADASDTFGHGTHVAGTLAANSIHHLGVAPACRIVPVKIMTGAAGDDGFGIGPAMARGLNWVLDNADAHDITAVCLSVGDSKNYADDAEVPDNSVSQAIRALAARNIPVVASAGNRYGIFSTEDEAKEGMCFPAIVKEVVSVGAVYNQPCNNADPDRRCFLGEEYGNLLTTSSRSDQVAIYSQRLEKTSPAGCGTTIFATGSWVTATGIEGNAGSSIVQGTSEAAPIVAGIIALLQSLHLQQTGERRPDIGKLVRIIRDTARPIDDDSLVTNRAVTGKRFLRVDALAAVKQLQQELQVG